MSPQARLDLRLDMLSDWAIGTGTGRQGSLDSLAERDADGFPCIPATSLRGMWRDAAETVAAGLDDGRRGAWSALVDELFGSQPAIDGRSGGPVRSRLAVAAARYPAALRDFVRRERKKRFRDGLFFVRPGVKIDPATGSAEQDFLRFDEVARAGAVLHAGCRLAPTGDEALDRALLALAVAALALLERIGGDRRRGRGACSISLASVDGGAAAKAVFRSGKPNKALAEAVAWIEANPSPAIRAAAAGPLAETAFAAAQSGAFTRYALDVELLAPACIADEVQGNVVTTLRTIPGSLLLGAAFGHLAAATGLDVARLRTMAACGDLRVLDARPDAQGRRSAPAPLIFEAPKEQKKDRVLRNRIFGAEPAEQHKVVRGELAVADGLRLLTVARPRTVLRTHNSVDDEAQKPNEDSGGGVYVLEALATGTRLLSEIWLRGAVLSSAIEVEASVGRAKNAGYGRIRLRARPQALEAPPEPAAREGGTLIWARSDIVLPSGCASAAEAVEVLLDEHGLAGLTLDPASAVPLKRCEGWVAAWGLPRPTITAIAAGATMMLHGDVPAGTLAALAHEGLGDRRAEGFGEISVNDAILFEPGPQAVPAADRDGTPGAPTGAVLSRSPEIEAMADHVRTVERAALTALIADLAEARADPVRAKLGWGSDKPNMAQVGRLRAALGDCGESGRAAAVRLLERILDDDKRTGAWGGREVVQSTRDFVSDTAGAWKILALTDADWDGSLVSMSRTAAKDELGRTALLFLMRAAMRGHKRGLEKEADRHGA